VIYDDVVQFWSQTKTNYTPTLVVTYGGPAGDPYWRQHTDVWKHPLLSRHAPPGLLQSQNVRRVMAPEEDYVDADSAREAKKLADRGVQVSIGAHGQQAGLGPHWEMWSFVRGGWSPIEALRAATIMPATSLGYQKDVGSLEPGKLADLVVLDADPTVDIRNTDKVRQVMLGGRLYDSAKIYRMEIPFSPDEFKRACIDTVAANDFNECYLRPIVYRGFHSLGVFPAACPVDVAIGAWRWGKYLGAEALEQGVDVCVSSWNRMAPNTFPALAKATGDKKIDTVPLKDVEPLTGYVRGGVTALACKKVVGGACGQAPKS